MPEAIRQFGKLDGDVQRMIYKKLEYFLTSSTPLSFAHHLKNFPRGQYRFRIGDYRVVFDLIEDVLLIHAVGHRREIYK